MYVIVLQVTPLLQVTPFDPKQHTWTLISSCNLYATILKVMPFEPIVLLTTKLQPKKRKRWSQYKTSIRDINGFNTQSNYNQDTTYSRLKKW